MSRWTALLFPISALCVAADAPPQFTPQGLVRGSAPAHLLVPGANRMSIYGENLGPLGGCAGSADPKRHEAPNPRQTEPHGYEVDDLIYPTALCGVQVLIGDRAAGLLYVSPQQINFKVPLDTPEADRADLRVVYRGQASAPLSIPVGFETTTIGLEQPAYVGSPVWLKASMPYPQHVGYPVRFGPADFGCYEVEARRADGTPLVRLSAADWARGGGIYIGPPCGSGLSGTRHPDALPIHLIFRFDEAGTYQVRFTYHAPGVSAPRLYQSEWTWIQILPPQPQQRAAWLAEIRAHPPTDPAQLLTDTLPNLLASPDDASLEILTGYLHDPNPAVQRYAKAGLAYWREDAVYNILNQILRWKGSPTPP